MAGESSMESRFQKMKKSVLDSLFTSEEKILSKDEFITLLKMLSVYIGLNQAEIEELATDVQADLDIQLTRCWVNESLDKLFGVYNDPSVNNERLHDALSFLLEVMYSNSTKAPLGECLALLRQEFPQQMAEAAILLTERCESDLLSKSALCDCISALESKAVPQDAVLAGDGRTVQEELLRLSLVRDLGDDEGLKRQLGQAEGVTSSLDDFMRHEIYQLQQEVRTLKQAMLLQEKQLKQKGCELLDKQALELGGTITELQGKNTKLQKELDSAWEFVKYLEYRGAENSKSRRQSTVGAIKQDSEGVLDRKPLRTEAEEVHDLERETMTARIAELDNVVQAQQEFTQALQKEIRELKEQLDSTGNPQTSSFGIKDDITSSYLWATTLGHHKTELSSWHNRSLLGVAHGPAILQIAQAAGQTHISRHQQPSPSLIQPTQFAAEQLTQQTPPTAASLTPEKSQSAVTSSTKKSIADQLTEDLAQMTANCEAMRQQVKTLGVSAQKQRKTDQKPENPSKTSAETEMKVTKVTSGAARNQTNDKQKSLVETGADRKEPHTTGDPEVGKFTISEDMHEKASTESVNEVDNLKWSSVNVSHVKLEGAHEAKPTNTTRLWRKTAGVGLLAVLASKKIEGPDFRRKTLGSRLDPGWAAAAGISPDSENHNQQDIEHPGLINYMTDHSDAVPAFGSIKLTGIVCTYQIRN